MDTKTLAHKLCAKFMEFLMVLHPLEKYRMSKVVLVLIVSNFPAELFH